MAYCLECQADPLDQREAMHRTRMRKSSPMRSTLLLSIRARQGAARKKDQDRARIRSELTSGMLS